MKLNKDKALKVLAGVKEAFLEVLHIWIAGIIGFYAIKWSLAGLIWLIHYQETVGTLAASVVMAVLSIILGRFIIKCANRLWEAYKNRGKNGN